MPWHRAVMFQPHVLRIVQYHHCRCDLLLGVYHFLCTCVYGLDDQNSGGLIPMRGWEFFSSPLCPDRV